MAALWQMTSRWTAEFALRPFLDAEPARTLLVLERWAQSPDQHLRRAASESTRPRLPWGMRLRGFVADPAPVIALIEPLRDDPSEYVRRSVANNLNDIGKDHPELLVQVASRWWRDGSARTRKLVKHALRSLVKAGHPGALRLLGFTVPAQIDIDGPRLSSARLTLGGTQVVRACVTSTSDEPQRIVVDIVLHLIGARGQDREKVFKARTFTLQPQATEEIEWTLAIRPISTRAYYAGRHGIELLVCGERQGRVDFELLVPEPSL